MYVIFILMVGGKKDGRGHLHQLLERTFALLMFPHLQHVLI